MRIPLLMSFVFTPNEVLSDVYVYLTPISKLALSKSSAEGKSSVISAKWISVLAISAKVSGSNTTVDGNSSTSLKAL